MGINQTSQSKYYSKGRISPMNTSKSLYMDPFENDFYSLGVVLLEMLTLQPIESILEDVINDEVDAEYLRKLKKRGFEFEEGDSAMRLLSFVKGLLNPKEIQNLSGNRGGLNSLYHAFEESINYERLEKPHIQYN